MDRSHVQYKKVSHLHEAVINFMIQNPRLSLAEVADHFDMASSTLRIMSCSSAFQARKKAKQDFIFADIAAHQTAALTEGLSRATELLESETSLPVVIKSVKELHEMRMAEQGGGAQAQAEIAVSMRVSSGGVTAETLERLRGLIGEPSRAPLPPPSAAIGSDDVIEGTLVAGEPSRASGEDTEGAHIPEVSID